MSIPRIGGVSAVTYRSAISVQLWMTFSIVTGDCVVVVVSAREPAMKAVLLGAVGLPSW